MALLLFDIDGTLIRPMGLGRRAFEEALREIHGRVPADNFPFDGLLDTQIARQTLSILGLAPTARAVDNLLGRYIELLQGQPPSDPAACLCPGIPGVLDEATRRGHHLGLLTGNVREGARVKLSFMGLDGYFRPDGDPGVLLGAFGDDAEERAGLVPVALSRCGRAFGEAFPAETTWIIGDSPRDVAAARAGRTRCAAVATGLASLKDLAATGPDLLLSDLSYPRPLWACVEGSPFQ